MKVERDGDEIVLRLSIAEANDMLADARAIDGEWGIGDGGREPEWADPIRLALGPDADEGD